VITHQNDDGNRGRLRVTIMQLINIMWAQADIGLCVAAVLQVGADEGALFIHRL